MQYFCINNKKLLFIYDFTDIDNTFAFNPSIR